MATLTTVGRVKEWARAHNLPAEVQKLCIPFLGQLTDDNDCIVPDEVLELARRHGIPAPAGIGIIAIG